MLRFVSPYYFLKFFQQMLLLYPPSHETAVGVVALGMFQLGDECLVFVGLVYPHLAQYADDAYCVIFIECPELPGLRVRHQYFHHFVAGKYLFPYVVHMITEAVCNKRMELFYVLANLVYDTFFAGVFGLFYV